MLIILWLAVLIASLSSIGAGVYLWRKLPDHIFDMGDHPRSERW